MEPRDVGAALDRILATPAFVRSPRVAGFLRYVVEQRLRGRTDPPKEVEIGCQVFGRASDYDTRIDPVVRVQARLLRFKLHEYYETEGKHDSARIELPKGSYLPVFSSAEEGRSGEVGSDANHTEVPRRKTRLAWTLFGVLLAFMLTAIAVSVNSWRDAIGRVWAKTLPTRPSMLPSPAADLYLKGRYYWNKRTPEDLRKALDYFTQSIVADPGYAKAYVGLADCYGLLREFAGMPDSDAWPRAMAAARKAVELDDSLAEAHSTLGFDLFYGSLDIKGGEREFQRAIELNPNYAQVHQWYATALMSVGRLTQASGEMERARELDPGSRSILSDQGLLWFYQGKTAEAVEQLQQVEAAEPTFRSAHTYLAFIHLNAKDCKNYLLESRKAAESAQDMTELAVVSEAERGYAEGGWRGMLQRRLGIEKKLAMEGRYPAFGVAETCALLGRKADALKYLSASYSQRELSVLTLAIDPALVSLRNEPEYRHMLVQLGLDGPS